MPAVNTSFCMLFFLSTLTRGKFVDVDVGIVLDMDSWIGKSIHSSIMMAISDFYGRTHSYETRIIVHMRDSKGDRLQAMSSVLDLLNTVKVKAIIGPDTYIGSDLLGSVADAAKVPIFSFAAGKSLTGYSYLLHIKQNEISMAKSICALVESYKWRDVIYVYEDSDHGSNMLNNLFILFQDKNIRISYAVAITASTKKDQIINELHKLMSINTRIVIVDMSPLLASRFFPYAKKLGMMEKDYAWILSQRTIDVLQSTKFEVIKSLQGALGFRSYVPASRKLHYLTQRWNKKFTRKVHVLGVWAYDIVWALAESVERVGDRQNGTLLLNEVLKSEFKGVSGQFKFTERSLISYGYEIVNAVDYGERNVGYWTSTKGVTRTHLPINNVTLRHGIGMEDVIWPGGTTTIPSGWSVQTGHGKKLKIGVLTGLTFKYFVDAVYDDQNNVTNATGFCVDVFNACLHALPYEVPYEFVPYVNGSYDKLIEKVYNKEIDGILGDSTILAKRYKFVEFTATYTDVGLGTLVKGKRKDMWIFLKPLNANLWLTFVAFLIFNGFVIWAIETMNQESKCTSSQGIGTIFWLIVLTIFSAQKEKLTSNLSRFVMFVWLIVVLVLISSYTATLTSLLTVEQFEIASKDAGIVNESFLGEFTVNNTDFTGSMLMPYYSYDDYAIALTKGGKHGGADAIVDEVPYIKMFLGKYPNGDYAMVSSEPVMSGFAFIFAKGSPLVKDMSSEIARIREDGTLKALEKKWFENELPLLPQDYASTNPKTLSLERLGGLFVISGVSSCLALIISAMYMIRPKLEILSIMSVLLGRGLMGTIRQFLLRRVTSSRMPTMNINFCILLMFICTLNRALCGNFVDVDVGIVLDMESWIGKSIHASVMMAISDFYARNHSYKTRIVVHTRDSKGDKLKAMSTVLDLLNTGKANAIIGPETYIGSELLGSIAGAAKVPIISFAGKSLMKYPYLLHIKEDEISMAKSICALVESYRWKDVIYVYEDTDHGSELLQNLFDLFQDNNIRIRHRIVISASAKNDQMVEELRKLISIHTTVIIVDMSPSLASRFFPHAKRLGMMSKEYAWILSQKTIDVLQSTKLEVIESLQGTLGFRSYVPASRRLYYFTQRWNKMFSRKVHVLAIQAYDTVWALAESIERIGGQQNGTLLLTEILRSEFKGVSGEFKLTERSLISEGFEIVNAANYGERKVGYWTLSQGITRTYLPFNGAVLHSGSGMEEVIWPGGSTTIPNGRIAPAKKLRIGVRTGLKFRSFVHAVYDEQNDVTNATGFCVDVFNACLQALPYEVTYEFVAYANGSYDKLIEKVYNKEIDGVLGDSTILAKRYEFVDFTATYTDLGLGTLAKTSRKDMWIFLKPLNMNLWLTFIAFLIFNGFVIWAIETMDQESKCTSSQGIGTIFWLIILTIFSAQKEKLARNLSRCVMFVWLIVVLILISSYTATLTSLLTVEQFEIASKGGIVGFHGGSFFGGVTVTNTNFTDSKQRSYYSYEDYANALTKGGKHGGADAIVDEVPYIKMFLGKYSNGDYAMVSSEPITSGFAFIFTKGSPLVKDISREIAKIREDGTLRNLEKKWFDTEFSVLPQDSSTMPKSLSLERFGGLFVISGVSSCLALFISVMYLIRAKTEILSIISLLGGRSLMATIRYLFHRKVVIYR
ncbi:hypothetical protein QVD17_00488 [Tagetes erecta]|uniref:Ionotropic glutamate receptor C-terminal domain-containing protein n=1 Tax=Tagetes erecta TaxID=13708 RepID=A0AAD8L7X5_TARER|nr:hypothetical protein QVD17_00488 [Tagetes erecta]